MITFVGEEVMFCCYICGCYYICGRFHICGLVHCGRWLLHLWSFLHLWAFSHLWVITLWALVLWSLLHLWAFSHLWVPQVCYICGFYYICGRFHICGFNRALSRNKPNFLNNYKFIWTLGPITVLGITFDHSKDNLFHLNVPPKLSRFKRLLNLWFISGPCSYW